jgi:DNA topoisomerase-1
MPVKKQYIKKVIEINNAATYLIIVESPSKCSKIESYLGSEYSCIASNGHIRTIDGLKAIDIKNGFAPTFSIIDEKKDHVDKMKSIIKNFRKENIILATDDDREGEAIAWHICEIFGLSVEKTQRIIFHEVTKPALLIAVKNPVVINMNIVKAQHARQVLDIIVGYKISPYLWKYLYHNKTNSLSAGRCQTPALRLVYDNELEKDKSTELRYKTTGVFFAKNITFNLNHEFLSKEEVLDFLDKSKTHNHEMKIEDPKKSVKSQPKPFNTSRLLQTASNNLNMSPKETMSLCQKLYQSGYITYMRTESSLYSGLFLEKAGEFIKNEYDSKCIGDLSKIENKDSSNPHEAIRVTQLELKSVSDTNESRISSLYKLIWKNTIESCMCEASYNVTKIEITAPDRKSYEYHVEVPIFLGWKIVTDKVGNNQNEMSALLLYFKSISPTQINYQHIESSVVVRNKHQRYTEASLINKLEELGIGRPSTFSSIIETVKERGYVKKMDIEGSQIMCEEFKLTGKTIELTKKERIFGKENNKLVIQSIGILTIEFLLKSFDSMFSYEYTKNMEEKLDKLCKNNEEEWTAICNECYNDIESSATNLRALEKKAYSIDDNHDFLFEKYGPVIRHKLENGEVEFLPVKKELNIDIKKLELNGYSLTELIEIKTNYLGQYEEKELYLKTGKFGPYIEWGSNRESIKNIKKPLNEITLKDIEAYLSCKQDKVEKIVLRILNQYMSVRKGKFGPYVYYKRLDMAKPDFLSIKNFKQGFFACEIETLVKWLKETYNLPDE